MNPNIGLGAGLVLLAGFLNGSFAVPMKRMPAWRWENTWFIYSVIAMVVAPWLLALVTVPELGNVYHQAAWPVLARVGLFGLGWGVGSTLFGLGISRVGMALGFAIILGITASLGSLLPLLVLEPSQLFAHRGLMLLAGLALVIFGIGLCSIAGREREGKRCAASSAEAAPGFGWGVVICVFSGIFSAMLNFSFVFGKLLVDASVALGTSATMAANPVWALALSCGFLANAWYCLYLLSKHQSWPVFATAGTQGYWLGALVMGVVWFGGIAVYGIGAGVLGRLGAVVGWPLFMAMNIIAANIWGGLTGEWKGATRRAHGLAWSGLAVLIAAIYVVSLGNQ